MNLSLDDRVEALAAKARKAGLHVTQKDKEVLRGIYSGGRNAVELHSYLSGSDVVNPLKVTKKL